MIRRRTTVVLCLAATLTLSIYLGVRAWNNRIQTFQGVVTTDILYGPEDAGTGVILQTTSGRIELEWTPMAKHREMAERLDGKTVIVSGCFRKGTSQFSRRARLRVTSLIVVPADATSQSAGGVGYRLGEESAEARQSFLAPLTP
ncbi:MAG TPA: hypothetical protein P5081_04825 [Phycisphaerae bacterium]|nr:hypothetical protein [Phycisphaerae bacterium]HRW52187.1 hypothetical protein [Phycisphaerae bacterium]